MAYSKYLHASDLDHGHLHLQSSVGLIQKPAKASTKKAGGLGWFVGFRVCRALGVYRVLEGLGVYRVSRV